MSAQHRVCSICRAIRGFHLREFEEDFGSRQSERSPVGDLVIWWFVSYLPASVPRIRTANAPYRRRPITTINRITTEHSQARDRFSGNLSFAFILGLNGRPPLADVTVQPLSVAGILNVSWRQRVFLLTTSFVYLCVSRIGRPADTFSCFYRAVAPYYHRSRVVLFLVCGNGPLWHRSC